MDRGLNKRTYAALQDAVVVLGCPLLEQTTAPVDVAEGLADALALAARSPAPAVATLGTSGMNSAIIADWLATSPDTRVWADRDEAKAGRVPPGQRHGRELMRLVNDAGGNATALHTPSPHKDPAAAAASMRFNDPGPAWREYARTLCRNDGLPPVGDRPAGHRHLCGGSVMTMKGEPVPPEGLDHIKELQKWLEQYPNDVMVRAKLAEIQRDPRFAEPDEPDDIMPQIPELAEFPVPPGLKKYIDATRIVAGASVPTSAACIAAAFNLLAAEDIDVQSRANAPHPSGLYFVVGSESGWRKSASFRETMQGHVEADERVEVLHHEADSNTEEGMEFRAKGFSPRALRQDFTIEALLSRLWKARRTMAVANSDASSLLGGWSFRKDNLSRSLSHFVSLWDGDPTSIDRRNPESPEIFFYQRRLTALIMGQVNVIEDLLFSQAAGNGFTARCLPSMDRERPKPPADTSTTHQAALDTIADMRELVIRRRADQDANAELLQGVLRRPVIHPDHDARDLLAAASAKFDALADATDNVHERGFWARAQEQTARYAATLAYVRTLEDGIPQSWEHVHYTRPEVDQAEAVITWHGELIRSYAVQAASEKITRLANETITMLREKREKVQKEDGSIAARAVIARMGKAELRTDAMKREQVIDLLVTHRHLIPVARKGHYMMMVPHV